MAARWGYVAPTPDPWYSLANDRTFLVVLVLVFLGGVLWLTWSAHGIFHPLLPLWALMCVAVWVRNT